MTEEPQDTLKARITILENTLAALLVATRGLVEVTDELVVLAPDDVRTRLASSIHQVKHAVRLAQPPQ